MLFFLLSCLTEEDLANRLARGKCEGLYVDADGDGYGLELSTACAEGAGVVPLAGDCNDGNPLINPGAIESCDTPEDDNCDEVVNELNAAACTNWYIDADGDGIGAMEYVCSCAPIEEYKSEINGDCSDDNSSIYPDAVEVCEDLLDNNCDGSAAPCLISQPPQDLLTLHETLAGELQSDHLWSYGPYTTEQSAFALLDIGASSLQFLTLSSDLIGPFTISSAVPLSSSSVVQQVTDMNDDGLAELVLSEPALEGGVGSVQLLLSPFEESSRIWSDGQLGYGSATTFIEGSGGQLAFLSPAASTLSENDGLVLLYDLDEDEASYRLYGSGGLEGGTLYAGADVDGDGLSDLLISEPSLTVEATDTGSEAATESVIYAARAPIEQDWFLTDLSISWKASALSDGSVLGGHIGGQGDLNGDGRSEFLTSSGNDLLLLSAYEDEPLLRILGTPERAAQAALVGDLNGDDAGELVVQAAVGCFLLQGTYLREVSSIEGNDFTQGTALDSCTNPDLKQTVVYTQQLAEQGAFLIVEEGTEEEVEEGERGVSISLFTADGW